MRKMLSERNLVVILFIVALVVFSFAQADARKLEEQRMQAGQYHFNSPGKPALANQQSSSASPAARD